MPRVKLIIEYDGYGFNGWQSQKNQPTIQDSIESALVTVFREQIRITGSGRTDSGVHARNQVAHADIPEMDLLRLKRSLNGLIPEAIVIKDIRECSSDFHARYDAVSRRYRYYISRVPTAINRTYMWQTFFPLNYVLMQLGATRLTSVTDFKSFCKTGSSVKHYQCNIRKCTWNFTRDVAIFEIIANRFLHGMVRAIVGTLIEMGRGQLRLDEFEKIIKARDRRTVRYSVPPQGLVLEEVVY